MKIKLLNVEPIRGQESKICWECKHIDYWPGEPHYSELTPGSDMVLECGKDYWDANNGLIGGGAATLENMLKSAQRCPDFKERD